MVSIFEAKLWMLCEGTSTFSVLGDKAKQASWDD